MHVIPAYSSSALEMNRATHTKPGQDVGGENATVTHCKTQVLTYSPPCIAHVQYVLYVPCVCTHHKHISMHIRTYICNKRIICTHNTHNTHSTHSKHSTHSIHNTYSTHRTHSTYVRMYSTHNMYSTHVLYIICSIYVHTYSQTSLT